MIRFLMAAVLLTALAACSSDPASAPETPTVEKVESSAEPPFVQAEMAVRGEKRRIKWPLVPGWDTIYGPEGCEDARFKRTVRDATNVQGAVDRFMESGYPVYPNHLYVEYNDAGRTVADYMPGNGMVINAYWGYRMGITMGITYLSAGEISYSPITGPLGWNIGYRIEAIGADYDDYFEFVYVDSSLIGGP